MSYRDDLRRLGLQLVKSPSGGLMLGLPGTNQAISVFGQYRPSEEGDDYSYVSPLELVQAALPGWIKDYEAKPTPGTVASSVRESLQSSPMMISRGTIEEGGERRDIFMESQGLVARRGLTGELIQTEGRRQSIHEIAASGTLQGHWFRPGERAQGEMSAGGEDVPLGTRAVHRTALDYVAGIIQRGNEIYSGSKAPGNLVKDIQFAARQRVPLAQVGPDGEWGMMPTIVSSVLPAAEGAMPEVGNVLQTRTVFGSAMPPGQGYAESNIRPLDVIQQNVRIRREDVQFFREGQTGQMFSAGESLPAFSLGGLQHHITVPQNWGSATLTGAEVVGAGTDNPAVRLTMVGFSGDWALKSTQGSKGYMAPVQDLNQQFVGGVPEGTNVILHDVKNWRMRAAAQLGAMPTDVLGGYLGRAAGTLGVAAPQQATAPNPLGEGTVQGYRWTAETDPIWVQAHKDYLSEPGRLSVQEQVIPVSAMQYLPWKLGQLKSQGKDLGIFSGMAVPRVSGLRRVSGGFFGLGAWEGTQRNVTMDAAELAQARREWQYGRTRMSIEESAQMAVTNPDIYGELESKGMRKSAPFIQAMKLSRYYLEEGFDPGPAKPAIINDRGEGISWASARARAAEQFQEGMTPEEQSIAAVTGPPPGAIINAAADMWGESQGDYMMSMNVMGEELRMMSPVAHRNLTTGDPQLGARLSHAYMNVINMAEGLETTPTQGGKEAMLLAYGKYMDAVNAFAELPGVKKKVSDTLLGNATEGTYYGSGALNPGEVFMGRERWQRLFPQLKDDRYWSSLQSQLSGGKGFFGLGWRRPTSDWGQIASPFGMVSESAYQVRGGQIDPNSDALVISQETAAQNYGDFDADRYMAVLAASLKFDEGRMRVSWKNPKEIRQALGGGRKGTWQTGLIGNTMNRMLSGLTAVTPRNITMPGVRDEEGNPIKMPLRTAIAQFRATQFYGDVVEGYESAGLGPKEALQWMTMQLGGLQTGSNEMRDWIDKMAMAPGDPDKLRELIAERMGMSMTWDEFRDASVNDVFSKELMGASYNFFQRDLGAFISPEARRALLAPYQKALDRTLGQTDTSTRMMLSLYNTYAVTERWGEGGREKGPYGAWGKFLTPEERERMGISKGMQQPLTQLVAGLIPGMQDVPDFAKAELLVGRENKEAYRAVFDELRGGGNKVISALDKALGAGEGVKAIALGPAIGSILDKAWTRGRGRLGEFYTPDEMTENRMQLGEARAGMLQVLKPRAGTTAPEYIGQIMAGVKAYGEDNPLSRAMTGLMNKLGGESVQGGKAVSAIEASARIKALGHGVDSVAGLGYERLDVLSQVLLGHGGSEGIFNTITPSEMTNFTAGEAAFSFVSRALRNVKSKYTKMGRGGEIPDVLPEDIVPFKTGLDVHEEMQKMLGLGEEQYFKDPDFFKKMGVGNYGSGGYIDVPLERSPGSVVDIKPVAGLSKAETREEYEEMVNKSLGRRVRLQQKMYQMLTGRERTGILGYDPDLAKSTNAQGIAYQAIAQARKFGLIEVGEGGDLKESIIHGATVERVSTEEDVAEAAQKVIKARESGGGNLMRQVQRWVGSALFGGFGQIAAEGAHVDDIREALLGQLQSPTQEDIATQQMIAQGIPEADIVNTASMGTDVMAAATGLPGGLPRVQQVQPRNQPVTQVSQAADPINTQVQSTATGPAPSNDVLANAFQVIASYFGGGQGQPPTGGNTGTFLPGYPSGGQGSGSGGWDPRMLFGGIGPNGANLQSGDAWVPDKVVEGLIALKDELDPESGNKLIGRIKQAAEVVENFTKKFESGEGVSYREKMEAGEASRFLSDALPWARARAAEANQAFGRWGAGLSTLAQTAEEGSAEQIAAQWMTDKRSSRWDINATVDRAARAQQGLRAEYGAIGAGIQRPDGFLSNLMQEFSFGGAAIKIGIAQRYTTSVANQWAAEGARGAMSRQRFAFAMGATPSDVMASTTGDILSYQARMQDYQAARGEAALQVQGGAQALMSDVLGEAAGEGLARTVGGVGSIGLRAGGNALTAGIVASTLGKLMVNSSTGSGTMSTLGRIGGSALISGAGTLALGAGLGTGLYYAAGGIYGAGTEENIQREWAQYAAGEQGDRNLGLAIAGAGRAWRAMKQGNWNLNPFSEDSAWRQGKWEGFDEYTGSQKFQIDNARLYIENLDLGLSKEQAAELGTLASLMGATPEGIQSGRSDALLERLAPSVRLGMGGDYIQGVMQAGRAAGLSPGAGLEALGNILVGPENTARYQQQQDAIGVLGSVARRANRGIDAGKVNLYADLLAGGMTSWELLNYELTMEGFNPLASVMGWQQGGEAAKSLAGWTTTDPNRQSALAQTYSQYGSAISAGAYARGGQGFAANMRSLQVFQGMIEGARLNPTQTQRLAEWYGGTGLEEMGLWAGTEEALQFASSNAPNIFDEVGWSKYQGAKAATGAVWQRIGRGGDRGAIMARYNELIDSGLGSQAALRATDLDFGAAGVLGPSMGGLSGFGGGLNKFESAIIQVENGSVMMQQVESIGRFGQSELGYSMLAGSLGGGGVGAATRTLYGGLAAAGLGTMPTGPGLYVEAEAPTSGGTGIYGFKQLEMDQRRQEYQAASIQRTLGTGRWATQTVPTWQMNVPVHRSQFTPEQLESMGIPDEQTFINQMQTVGGGTFQMGMIGETQNAIEGFKVWKQTKGIDAQMLAASRAAQDSQSDAALQRLNLQHRQSLESLAMSQLMWGTNVAFQRQEMGFGWEQMQTQQQWGYEDLALGRQQAGYAHEFQMDESRRAWRMASGRDKARLGRQMEYQEEMFSFAETGRANDEERFQQREEWEEAQFERQREHFEEVTALQEEQFEMQRRHIEEKYALELGLLNQQKKQIGHMRELEDERRKITDAWEEKQKLRTIAKYMQDEAWYRDVEIPYKQWLVNTENEIRDAHAKYLKWQVDQINVLGGDWEKLINQIADMLEQVYPDLKLDRATWKDIETNIAEPPKARLGGVPENIKIYINDQEFSAVVVDVTGEAGEASNAVEEWGVYE